METILKFLGEHIFIVSAVLVGLFVLSFLIIFKGISFETKGGNKFKIGGITKNRKELFSKEKKEGKEECINCDLEKKEELKNFLLINNLINTWKNRLNKKIEKTKSGLVVDCIRHADSLINKNMNDIKRKYLEIANKEKRLNEKESPYQTMIFNLLIDRATEDVKTFLYEIIRADHFNSKTQEELEQINENCINKIDETLDENVLFNLDIIKELKKNYSRNIKEMSYDIITVSSKKYEILKKYKHDFIEESQSGMKEELNTRFGFLLSEGDLESLIEYDE